MLNVVKLSELPAVVGRNELLKFFQRLVAEIPAIDQKENAPRASQFNQPINKIGSGVCFAAASRHLHKRAPFVFGKRLFQLVDRFDLRRPKISRRHPIRCRKIAKALIELSGLLHPLDECLWSMKSEKISTCGDRIESVGQTCFGAGRFVREWQRIVPLRMIFENSFSVFAGLFFDANKRVAFRLCFHRADYLFVSEEEIVCFAAFQKSLTQSDTAPGGKVDIAAILKSPATLTQQLVDLLARELFRGLHEVRKIAEI